MNYAILSAALLLTACSGDTGDDRSAAETQPAETMSDESASADGANVSSSSAADDEAMSATRDTSADAPPSVAEGLPVGSPTPTLLGKMRTENIPARFRGRWALSPSDCGPASNRAITITKDAILFFETSGMVEQVDQDGRYAAVKLDEAVGEINDRYTLYLGMEGDGKLSTRRGSDGSATRYARCPSS